MKNNIIATCALFLILSNDAYYASNNLGLVNENCNNINDKYQQSDCLNYNKNLGLINELQNKISSKLSEKLKNKFNNEISLWQTDVGKFCSKTEYNNEIYYDKYGCLDYFTKERLKVLSYYQNNNYLQSDNHTGTYKWKLDKVENTFTMNNIEDNKINFEFVVSQPRGDFFNMGHAEGTITMLKNKAVYSSFREGKKCEIRFTLWGNQVDIRQKIGEDYECGFGSGVVAYNTFIKVNNNFINIEYP